MYSIPAVNVLHQFYRFMLGWMFLINAPLLMSAALLIVDSNSVLALMAVSALATVGLILFGILEASSRNSLPLRIVLGIFSLVLLAAFCASIAWVGWAVIPTVLASINIQTFIQSQITHKDQGAYDPATMHLWIIASWLAGWCAYMLLVLIQDHLLLGLLQYLIIGFCLFFLIRHYR